MHLRPTASHAGKIEEPIEEEEDDQRVVQKYNLRCEATRGINKTAATRDRALTWSLTHSCAGLAECTDVRADGQFSVVLYKP